MAVRITGNSSTVSVAPVRPRVSVAVQTANAGVTAQIPASSIAYIDLAVGAELDTTGRYRIVFETVTMSDGSIFNLAKPFSDSFGVATDSVTRATNKVLNDPVYPVEDLSYAFAKALQHSFGLSDEKALELVKPLSDAVSEIDDSTRHLTKLLQSGFALNDSLDAGDGLLYQVIKQISNVIFTAEQHAFSMEKLLADSQSILDGLGLDVSKPLADQYEVSDFSTRASLKALADTASPIDAAVFDLAKALSDLVAATEVNSFEIDKTLGDEATVPDDTVFDLAKLTADSIALASSIANAFNRPLVDVQFIAERKYLNVDKAAADEITSSDDFDKVIQKNVVSDVAVMTDFIDRFLVYVRDLTDAVAVDDSTGVGDSLAFQSIKTFNNVAMTGDVSVRTTSALKFDLLTVADTGSLVSQGYCDLTYFADDYVGATRTFI